MSVSSVRPSRGKTPLSPDAQYMGRVGLPRLIDKLLRSVLSSQPSNPRQVLLQIRSACSEELAALDPSPFCSTDQTSRFLAGAADPEAFLDELEDLSPKDRREQLRLLLSAHPAPRTGTPPGSRDNPLPPLNGKRTSAQVLAQPIPLPGMPKSNSQGQFSEDSLVGSPRVVAIESMCELIGPDLYRSLCRHISENFADRQSLVLLRDHDNEVIYNPLKPASRANEHTPGLVCDTVREGQPLLRLFTGPDATAPTATDALLFAEGCRSAIAVPIKSKSDILGVIAVVDNGEASAPQGLANIEELRTLNHLAKAISRVVAGAVQYEALTAARNQVDVLLDVARRLSSELEVKSLIRTIMQVSRGLLDADRSTLFLVDKEKDQLWSSVADGTSEIRIPRTAGIAGAVASAGTPLNIPDAYADRRFNPETDKKTGYKTHSMLCMPMKNRSGEVIGVTQMLNKKSGSAFGKEDERLLSAFSAQAAVAIENSLLFKSTEEAKNLFMSVLASIKNLIITLDINGRVITLNRDPAKFGIGIAREKMETTPYADWFVPKGDEPAPADAVSKQLPAAAAAAADERRRSFGPDVARMRSSLSVTNRKLCDSFINGLLLEDITECYKTGKERTVQDFTFVTIDPETRSESHLTLNYKIMALRDFDNVQTGVVISLEDVSNEAQMMATLGKYMSPEIAAAAMEGGTQLGGQELPVSVLFVDIRNFTGLSEALSAAEVVLTLNDYFQHMGGSVLDHGGIVDKYIGDAVMAVFGVPFPAHDDAHRVCYCALQMFKLLREWNERRESEGLKPIRMGIGVNTGVVVAGNIGFEKRMEYTVIGDGVNLASRMEGATKEYKTDVLITEFTFDQVADLFHTREVDCIRVVGKKLPVKIYELQGAVRDGPLPDMKQKGNELWRAGLALYKQRKWEEAKAQWSVAFEQYGDLTSKALIPRVELFLANPEIAPGDKWDGVWDMASK
ncbi:Adenylate cyclase 1 [Diplonema papillatum]|nr:Adenylate cyclase 1 [Diplonema papillatum]